MPCRRGFQQEVLTRTPTRRASHKMDLLWSDDGTCGTTRQVVQLAEIELTFLRTAEVQRLLRQPRIAATFRLAALNKEIHDVCALCAAGRKIRQRVSGRLMVARVTW